MDNQERKQLNMCIDIFNIYNYNNFIRERVDQESFSQIDIELIKDITEKIEEVIKRMKRDNVDYKEIKSLLQKNKKEITSKQYEELLKFID